MYCTWGVAMQLLNFRLRTRFHLPQTPKQYRSWQLKSRPPDDHFRYPLIQPIILRIRGSAFYICRSHYIGTILIYIIPSPGDFARVSCAHIKVKVMASTNRPTIHQFRSYWGHYSSLKTWTQPLQPALNLLRDPINPPSTKCNAADVL